MKRVKGHPRDCHCDECKAVHREDMRARRASKRTLTVVPALPAEPVETVVVAVQADLAEFGDLTGSRGLAAAALVLAKDLDNPGLGTSHPSLAKQLAAVLEMLRRSSVPRRGRLAVVQQMTTHDHA